MQTFQKTCDVQTLTNLIVTRYGIVLKNKEAAAVLRMPEWKLSEISREELPRCFGRGRGGIRILPHHLAEYIIANMEGGKGKPIQISMLQSNSTEDMPLTQKAA